MANAVFLCGECGQYFSTINDIRSHSCWGNAKVSSQGENESQDILSVEADDSASGSNQLVTVDEACLDASLALTLDDSYIKSACYAYVDEGKWTDDGIKLLIHLYKEKEAEFRNPEKKKREVWELVAAEMNKDGYLFTTDQVDTKWRNLKKAYWRSKEAQCEIGAPSKFPYEDLLDEVYGHIYPKKMQVSRVIPRVIRRPFVGTEDVLGDSLQSSLTHKRPFEGSRPGPKKKIARESQPSTDYLQELVTVLEHMREDRQEALEERRKTEEERTRLLLHMHEEKMNVLRELLQMVQSLPKRNSFTE